MADPSDPAYVPPAPVVYYEHMVGGNRQPSKQVPQRDTLKALGIDPGTRAVDRGLSVPLRHLGSGGSGEPVLDVARVAAEVMRGGQLMHTIAVSEATACVLYDAASAVGGLGLPQASGDFTIVVANKGRLVGHMLPVIGQLREIPDQANVVKPRRSMFERHLDPIEALGAGGELPAAHSFAFKTVQVSTTTSICGTGAFLLQGIIVSNRVYNYPEGHERRLSFGRAPAFEETLCWVLVTHAYPPELTYAAVGPPRTKTPKRRVDGVQRAVVIRDDLPGVNTYDAVFQWRAFMENHTDQKRCGVSAFAFADMKQTNKDIVRAMLPWPVEELAAKLADDRATGVLQSNLANLDMTDKGAKRLTRQVGGMDLRRMLLVELLLKGTPLAALLLPAGHEERTAAALVAALPPAPTVPGGTTGLYTRLKAFCDGLVADAVTE